MVLDNETFQILRSLNSISWEWDYKSLSKKIRLAGFSEKERIGNRIVYEMISEKKEIDVYIEDQDSIEVSFVEVPIYSYSDTEFLVGLEYDLKMNEMNIIYGEILEDATYILGTPEFINTIDNENLLEEYESLRASFWKADNAIILLSLRHQDSDLPIIISFFIESQNVM